MPSPFVISPNPTWLYLTPTLHGTLEKIRFSIREKQGLCCIMGDVGLGKSTILRYLNAEYQADEYVTAWLPKARFRSQFAMLKAICEDLEIGHKRSQLAQEKVLEEFLIATDEAGKTTILFIDEAQMMSAELLELIRILLNFETSYHKMLQIVMAGQLDLRDRIMLKKNKALASRIFAPCMLNALTPDEMAAMIAFRCERAQVFNSFTEQVVLDQIYSSTGGVPRDVLRICFHSWNLMVGMGQTRMTPELVDAAIHEANVQADEESQEAEAAVVA